MNEDVKAITKGNKDGDLDKFCVEVPKVVLIEAIVDEVEKLSPNIIDLGTLTHNHWRS
jgi:hypothetical protein